MLHYTYLASPREIADFGPNDLAPYQYLGLFEVGAANQEIFALEQNLILTAIAQFMRGECLFVAASHLPDKDAPDSFLASLYDLFTNPDNLTAYLALTTITPEGHAAWHLRPVYRSLTPVSERRYPWLEAVNAQLGFLKDALQGITLASFVPPKRGQGEAHYVTPDAVALRSYRKSIGTQAKVADTYMRYEGADVAVVSERSLAAAEQYGTVTFRTLDKLAKFFEVDVADLILERVVLNQTKLRELRPQWVGREAELVQTYHLPTPRFFELLMAEPVVDATIFRFVYDMLRKTCSPKLKEKDLIDGPQTRALLHP